MPGSDKRKQLLYLPEDVLQEIMREANRLDRSMSWTVQRAWCIARANIKKFPASEFRTADASGTETTPSAPRELRRDPEVRRTTTELDRARAETELREFLRNKFDRSVGV